MSVKRAYDRVDHELKQSGVAAPQGYVLWSSERDRKLVYDFAVPLSDPNRDHAIAAIERALGEQRGRDRVSAFALQLARLFVNERRRIA